MSQENSSGTTSNPDLLRPVHVQTLRIKGLGEVIMTSNNELNFDAEKTVRTIVSGQGNLTVVPYSKGNLYNLAGQKLLLREQGSQGSQAELQEKVRFQAEELNRLRKLGVSVLKHASLVLPVSHINKPEIRSQPSIITVTEKLEGQEKFTNFDIRDPANAGKVKALTQALQTYFTDNTSRKHLADITAPYQYASDGTLIDLDIMSTEVLGTSPTDEHETCGRQLREMYKDFKLTEAQIEELKHNYSANRPRIEINRPKTADAATGTIAGIVAQFHLAQSKAEKSAAAFQVAEELAAEASKIIESIGEWRSDIQDLTEATRSLWLDTARGCETKKTELEYGRDAIDEIIDRLLAAGSPSTE